METQTEFELQHAFIATQRDIEKLWKIFQDAGLPVRATASCTDGLTRYFDNCESLVRYENPKRAAITSIEMSALSNNYQYSKLQLGSIYRVNSPISISLQGEENVVTTMRTNISDTLDGMRPWYSKLLPYNFVDSLFNILVALSLIIVMLSLSKLITAMPFTEAHVALTIPTAALLLILLLTNTSLFKGLFPIATFAIGQGLNRHDDYEKIRWGVIVAFAVSVVASIITTILLT